MDNEKIEALGERLAKAVERKAQLFDELFAASQDVLQWLRLAGHEELLDDCLTAWNEHREATQAFLSEVGRANS